MSLPYQPIDGLSIITNMIFQGGLNREKLLDLSKKIMIAFLAKYGYDNLNRFMGAVINPDNLKNFLFLILYTGKISRLRFNKDSELAKLDTVLLTKLLDVDLKAYKGTFVKRIFGHIVLVNLTEQLLEIWFLFPSFEKVFLENCKLPSLRLGRNVKTDYKTLVSKGCKKDMTFSWEMPERITKMFDDTKDRYFFSMIETFVNNSEMLEDISTQSYMINGPPGVGKSSIVDHLYFRNVIHTILRINMMNFTEQNMDLEQILEKIVSPYPIKASGQTTLLILDEIDKWFNLWMIIRVKEHLESCKKTLTKEQIMSHIQTLRNQFYNTLQRLIDGEILTKLPRLILMFFTNNGDSLWTDLPADYESVKSRFVCLDFDYCHRDEVISYLKIMYKKLIEKNAERDIILTIDEKLYDLIPEIQISYRDLKALIVLSNYELEVLVKKLATFQGKILHQVKFEIDLDSLSQSEEDVDVETPEDTNIKVTCKPDPKPEVKLDKKEVEKKEPTVEKKESKPDKKESKPEKKEVTLIMEANTELKNLNITHTEEGNVHDELIAWETYKTKNILSYSHSKLVMIEVYRESEIVFRGIFNAAGDWYLKKETYRNGKLERVANCNEEGHLHGEQERFYLETGKHESIEHYVNGNLQGKYERFGRDGSLQQEGNYVDDKIEGEYITYEKGKIIKIEIKEKGSSVMTHFMKDGKETSRAVGNEFYRWDELGFCRDKEGKVVECERKVI